MKNDGDRLMDYETNDIVKRYLQKKYSKDVCSGKIKEINSNFIQGREYLISAEKSDFVVKPLLYYYGVVSLCKGLILLTNLGQREAHLKKSHGLKILNWNEVISDSSFERLQIKLTNGLFSELMNTTENKNYLRGNSNVVNYQSKLTMPDKNDIITLKQLINYYPDLNEEYKSWLDEELQFAIMKSFKYNKSNDEYVLRLDRKLEIEELNRYLLQDLCTDVRIEGEFVFFKSDKFGPNITQRWNGPFDIGDPCVIPAMENDIGLNLISGMYMITYVFGMLSRYYPTAWMTLQRGGKGDKIYPFVVRIMEFINNRIATVILDFIRAPYEFESNEK